MPGPKTLLAAALLPAWLLACGAADRSDTRPAPLTPAPTASGPTATAPLSPVVVAGEAVYRRENCARCHTRFDAPSPSGPPTLPIPSPAALVDSRVGPDLGVEGHRRSDDWHLAHLYAPEVVAPGSRMPASRHLFTIGEGGLPRPGDDALHLVAYLQTLGRERRDVWAEFRSREPEIPAPAEMADATRLERGRRLYGEHCAACHGDAGDGRGPASPLLLFPPRDFAAGEYRFRSGTRGDPVRDADLFRTITLGTGIGAAMPAFYFLSAEDRWALVRRIREFSPALRGRGVTMTMEGPPGGADAMADRSGEGERRDPGDTARGRALWGELGCGSCHGPLGAGMAREAAQASWTDGHGVMVPRSGDLRHACSLRAGGSEAAFRRAVLQGVGAAMPSFAGALGTGPDPIAALRAFLLAQDRNEDLDERPGP
jgi:mono/diheme cytochrome c family protein